MDVYVTHCLDHSGNFPVTSCKILLWNARTTASAQVSLENKDLFITFPSDKTTQKTLPLALIYLLRSTDSP